MMTLVFLQLLTLAFMAGFAYGGLFLAQGKLKGRMWVGVTPEASINLKMGLTGMTFAALGDDTLGNLRRVSMVAVKTAYLCLVCLACTVNIGRFSVMTHDTGVIGQYRRFFGCHTLFRKRDINSAQNYYC
jgi:hypothetical protein